MAVEREVTAQSLLQNLEQVCLVESFVFACVFLAAGRISDFVYWDLLLVPWLTCLGSGGGRLGVRVLICLLLAKCTWSAKSVFGYAGGGVNCLWWSHPYVGGWLRKTGVLSRFVVRCVVVLRSFLRGGVGFVAPVRIALTVRG